MTNLSGQGFATLQCLQDLIFLYRFAFPEFYTKIIGRNFMYLRVAV